MYWRGKSVLKERITEKDTRFSGSEFIGQILSSQTDRSVLMRLAVVEKRRIAVGKFVQVRPGSRYEVEAIQETGMLKLSGVSRPCNPRDCTVVD